jgi:hypothetical protein
VSWRAAAASSSHPLPACRRRGCGRRRCRPDPGPLWAALRERGIDARVLEWRGARLVRISIAPYNEWADLERRAGEPERLDGAS